MDEVEGDAKKAVISPYRLNLMPGVEQRRQQWNMIFISNTPVTVDFHHTDMLEKIVVIKKAEITPKNNEVIIE